MILQLAIRLYISNCRLDSAPDFGYKLGYVLVTVLGMPGPPTWQGHLLHQYKPILRHFGPFRAISKRLLISVHSVHFMNQGPIFGLPIT